MLQCIVHVGWLRKLRVKYMFYEFVHKSRDLLLVRINALQWTRGMRFDLKAVINDFRSNGRRQRKSITTYNIYYTRVHRAVEHVIIIYNTQEHAPWTRRPNVKMITDERFLIIAACMLYSYNIYYTHTCIQHALWSGAEWTVYTIAL